MLLYLILIPALYRNPNIIPDLQVKKLSLEQLDHGSKVTQVRSDGWDCNYGLTTSPALTISPQEVCINEDIESLNCKEQKVRS